MELNGIPQNKIVQAARIAKRCEGAGKYTAGDRFNSTWRFRCYTAAAKKDRLSVTQFLIS